MTKKSNTFGRESPRAIVADEQNTSLKTNMVIKWIDAEPLSSILLPVLKEGPVQFLSNVRVLIANIVGLVGVISQIEQLPIRRTFRRSATVFYNLPIAVTQCPTVGSCVPRPVQITLSGRFLIEKQGA